MTPNTVVITTSAMAKGTEVFGWAQTRSSRPWRLSNALAASLDAGEIVSTRGRDLDEAEQAEQGEGREQAHRAPPSTVRA